MRASLNGINKSSRGHFLGEQFFTVKKPLQNRSPEFR
jgi:hypothetical protein